MTVGWALRSLGRHPLRTLLSLAGIAVAAAMLLDMVMLSGGIERSFARLLLGRGYQIRLTPKGTLPFDAEATIAGIGTLRDTLRADPRVSGVAPVLGAAVHARRADSLVTMVGYGLDPADQGLYELEAGADLSPGDSSGALLSAPAARALGAGPGDTVRLVGALDPQMAAAGVERALVVRGLVRFLYDYRDQRSVATLLPVMQGLARYRVADRASVIMVKVRDDAEVQAVADRIGRIAPRVEANSVTELVAAFRTRMLYFRQLSYILGSMSLIVTVLLVATLLTITVSERLGEIATLRAIGVGRGRIVRQVLAEGALLTVLGSILGVLLGLATARYLDAILGDFPGLPAAFSFFVPRADSLLVAGAILLVTGTLAGLYPAWVAARAPIAATLRAEAT